MATSAMQFEFGSAAWLAMVERELTKYVEEARVTDLTVCEVYRHLPPHLPGYSPGVGGWTLTVRDRKVRFSLDACADDEAHVKLVGDYEALLPIARFVVTDDNGGQYQALWSAGEAEGRIVRVRDNRPPNQPHTVHNIIARQTL